MGFCTTGGVCVCNILYNISLLVEVRNEFVEVMLRKVLRTEVKNKESKYYTDILWEFHRCDLSSSMEKKQYGRINSITKMS